MSQIATPCLKICTMNAAIRGCIGCFRSREEIAKWLRYSDEERAAIMAELPARAEAFKALKAARLAARQAAQSSSEG